LAIPTLVYASGVGGKSKVKIGNERVVGARLVDDRIPGGHAMAVLLLSGSSGKGGLSVYSLALLNLSSGEVVKMVEIGNGTAAALSISKKAVVVVRQLLACLLSMLIRSHSPTLHPLCTSSPPPSNHSMHLSVTFLPILARHYPPSPSLADYSLTPPPNHLVM
jgi:hypothetical protein